MFPFGMPSFKGRTVSFRGGYNEFHYILNLGLAPLLPGFHWANAGLGPRGDSPNHLQTKSSCHPGGDYQHPHPGARARGKYPKSPTFGALVPSFRTNMCTSMPPGGDFLELPRL